MIFAERKQKLERATNFVSGWRKINKYSSFNRDNSSYLACRIGSYGKGEKFHFPVNQHSRVPRFELGETAVDLLLNLIENATTLENPIVLQPELIVRASAP